MASDDEFTADDGRLAVVRETVDMAISGEPEMEVRAAWEIRRLTKTSAKYRRLFAEAGMIEPLVGMLASPTDGCKEAALLALLNLAVKDERCDSSSSSRSFFFNSKIYHDPRLFSSLAELSERTGDRLPNLYERRENLFLIDRETYRHDA